MNIKAPVGPSAAIKGTQPTDQQIDIRHGDLLYHYSMATLLQLSGNIHEAVETHSAQQNYFEGLATDINRKLREFEEIALAKWWAHTRRHARFVMLSNGSKDTIDSLKDHVVLIFGEETLGDQGQMDDYGETAYSGWLLQTMGSLVKAIKYKADHPAESAEKKAQFQAFMFSYGLEGSYEAVIKLHLDLKGEAEKIRAFADVLNQRSFRIRDFVELEKGKHGNRGSYGQETPYQGPQVSSRPNGSGSMQSGGPPTPAVRPPRDEAAAMAETSQHHAERRQRGVAPQVQPKSE